MKKIFPEIIINHIQIYCHYIPEPKYSSFHIHIKVSKKENSNLIPSFELNRTIFLDTIINNMLLKKDLYYYNNDSSNFFKIKNCIQNSGNTLEDYLKINLPESIKYIN